MTLYYIVLYCIILFIEAAQVHQRAGGSETDGGLDGVSHGSEGRNAHRRPAPSLQAESASVYGL